MKYDCNIVQDLLPLYADRMCSEPSRKMVESHLEECEKCRQIAEQTMDRSIENTLQDEKKEVLQKHQRAVNRRTYMIGLITAGIFTIPIIVCLICNLATQHALDWFYIVLTSLLLVASIVVVPMVVYEKKLMWTVASSTVSLLLLLFTCCVYTGGDWFWLTGTACMLGISVLFAPFVVRGLPLSPGLANHKALIVLAWDCLWLYLLLIVCGIYVNAGSVYWQLAISITTYVLVLVWLWLVIIRYMKRNYWMKAGILTALSGLWIGIANDVLDFFLNVEIGGGLKYLDLREGFRAADSRVLNANITFTVMVILIGIGLICFLVGIGRDKKRGTKETHADNTDR